MMKMVMKMKMKMKKREVLGTKYSQVWSER